MKYCPVPILKAGPQVMPEPLRPVTVREIISGLDLARSVERRTRQPLLRRVKHTGRMVFWGLAWLLAVAGPLQAESLKSVMKDMAGTTKEAKAALSSTDQAAFDATLLAYADEAKAAMTLFPGASAKNQDLRTRFAQMAAMAEAAHRPGASAESKAAFGLMVGACRSCHTVYK